MLLPLYRVRSSQISKDLDTIFLGAYRFSPHNLPKVLTTARRHRYSHETTMPTVHSSKHRPTKSLDRPKSLNFEMSRMFSKGYEGIDTPALPADAHTLSQEPTAMTPGGGNHKKKWTGVLKDFPYATSVMSMGGKSTKSTPTTTPTMDRDEWIDERTASAAEREKKRKRRKKAEVFVCYPFFSISAGRFC